MKKKAVLMFDGKEYELPIIEGSEGERAIDIGKLRNSTGLITFDPWLCKHRQLQKQYHIYGRRKGYPEIQGYPHRAAC